MVIDRRASNSLILIKSIVSLAYSETHKVDNLNLEIFEIRIFFFFKPKSSVFVIATFEIKQFITVELPVKEFV